MNNKGSKYYNNGIKNIMIKDGDTIPEGFVPGMIKRSKEDKEKSNQKRKETNLKKYGGPAPLSSSEVRDKVKQTNIERYGVENPSQSEGIKSKRTNTMIERYGVENAMGSKELKERQKETVMVRYGVDNVFQNEDVKEKIKQTNLERYGVEYPTQSEEIKERWIQASVDKYGTKSPMQSDEIKEKTQQTNLKRYGSTSPWGSGVVREKAKKTLLENYGVENPMFSEEIKERVRQTNLERYGYECQFQNLEKISQTCQEKYGVPWACMRPEARAYSNDSGPNRAFAFLLDDKGIRYEREFHIKNYSYDFKIGNTLIEIDPYATHNSSWSPFGDGLEQDYHYNKSHTAEENGYHCIHVFDWDDVGKIINMLKDRESIYARNCEIREVSQEDITEFLNTYHLQNTCKGQTVRLGLYHNEELVSVMSFGVPRYNKNYEWELLRYCSIKNITGGSEKLFKYFKDKYKPESIISYCDNSKFRGDVYKSLGFTLKSEGTPSKHWYSPKEERHITDNLLRQLGYDKLFNENYGKGTSNEELIIERGYLPVYDCGQSVWVYEGDK